MRKIVVSEFMSADGVIEAPDTWQFPFQTEEMGAITERQTRDTAAFLYGRVTYDIFASFWPTQTNNEFGVADKLNSAPKYVVSKTLQKADWNNSTLINANVIEEIRKLKQAGTGIMAINGSVKLVHSLLDAGLIDEIQVLVHPIVLGKGVRLFADGYHSSMKLADSKILPNGVVYLSYQIEHQT
ncbi:MAG: dihydrofolate reductase family protein [Chloroflexota bacterium]